MQKLLSDWCHRRVVSAILLFLCFLSPIFITNGLAKSTPKTPLPLEHAPVASATAGKKIPIHVKISNKDDVIMVRLYFKTMVSSWYVFLNMKKDGKNNFTAILPPIKNDTKGIDYIIFFKNKKGSMIKSRTQRMLILNDYRSAPPPTEPFNVMTEYTRAPSELLDFAIPLQISVTADQLLANAQPFTYPPITVPGPASRKSGSSLGTLSGIAISIGVSSVGIHYRSSGQ